MAEVKEKKPRKKKKPYEGPICNAKTRKKDRNCQQPAGWRTDHPGTGRCILHGGFAKGPGPGNQNAFKTGEHAKIYLDQLTDEEKELLEQSTKQTVILKLEAEIGLANIRVRRMLQLRQKVIDGWEQDETENVYERRHTESRTADADGYELVEIQRTEKKREKLARVQAIEEGITRVQKEIAKMLEMKYKIETGKGDENQDPSTVIKVYLDALKGVGAEVWADDSEETEADNGQG